MRARIDYALQQAFKPTMLEVIDESHKHVGHAGYNDSGESHFKIIISAPHFATLSRLQSHRAIYEALGELMGSVHAVSIEIQ